MSKWRIYDDVIKTILLNNEELSDWKVSQIVLKAERPTTESDLLRTYIKRNRKRLLDKFEGNYTATDALDIDNTTVKHMWVKNKEASLFVKNPNFIPQTESETDNFKTLSDALIYDLKNYSPIFKKIEYVESTDSYLLVVDPADVHVGKLCSDFEVGQSYNNQIAVQRALEGVRGLLQKAKGFHIDQILFIGGNDILHIDSPARKTANGTPQDTDGMWHSNFLIAKQLYVDILEILLAVAPVHFDFNPSNHDYTNGFFLSQVIEAYFRHCKELTFNTSIAHRKYYKYHKNLIGTTHGDGAKMTDLPMLMATDKPVEWAETTHRYVYVHHLHHKWSKDIFSVCVEGLRSPSGTDSWHHQKGFEHAPKAVEGFLHSKNNGQIARLTHIFSLLFIVFSYITV